MKNPRAWMLAMGVWKLGQRKRWESPRQPIPLPACGFLNPGVRGPTDAGVPNSKSPHSTDFNGRAFRELLGGPSRGSADLQQPRVLTLEKVARPMLGSQIHESHLRSSSSCSLCPHLRFLSQHLQSIRSVWSIYLSRWVYQLSPGLGRSY